MHPPSSLSKILLLGVATCGLAATLTAQDISLLATDHGIAISTSMNLGNGQFEMDAPDIINQDIYKPVKPEIEVIDDHNLALRYPNGAEIKVSIAEAKVRFAYAKLPPEATRISMGFPIDREAWQGSKFSFDDSPAEAFPEEDERRNLFQGKAKVFRLIDPAGAGFALAGPGLRFTLANKGPEGWSQFRCSFSYILADHPNETEFFLDFRPAESR